MLTFAKFFEQNDALRSDKEVRRFTHNYLSGKFPDQKAAIQRLKEILQKYFDLFNRVLGEFVKLMKKALPKKGVSPNDIKFLYQTKTVVSIIDKVINRQKPLGQISDLVRGAILFKDSQMMRAWSRDFERKFSRFIDKVEVKDKSTAAFQETGYYGTIHYDLKILGLNVELQVATQKLWHYKHEAHKLYTKWRSRPEPMSAQDQELSKALFRIGNVYENEHSPEELDEWSDWIELGLE